MTTFTDWFTPERMQELITQAGGDPENFYIDDVDREMVRLIWEAAALVEREACARTCEKFVEAPSAEFSAFQAKHCANAIRARSTP